MNLRWHITSIARKRSFKPFEYFRILFLVAAATSARSSPVTYENNLLHSPSDLECSTKSIETNFVEDDESDESLMFLLIWVPIVLVIALMFCVTLKICCMISAERSVPGLKLPKDQWAQNFMDSFNNADVIECKDPHNEKQQQQEHTEKLHQPRSDKKGTFHVAINPKWFHENVINRGDAVIKFEWFYHQFTTKIINRKARMLHSFAYES